MTGFDKLSITPGYSVNDLTGDMLEIDVSNTVLDIKTSVSKYIEPSFEQNHIDQAREVTSVLGETVLCSLLGGKKMKNKNHRGHDLTLPGGKTMEAKTTRIGKGAVIKKHQLDIMNSEGLYGIVFYRTTDNKPTSYFIKMNTLLDPQTYLKRNINVKTIFIFPKSYIVNFYNTSKLKERKISTTGICYKEMSYKSAKKIFSKNEGKQEQFTTIKTFGKHKIEIFSVGYDL